MKCYMGHFGQTTDSQQIEDTRIEEKEPAMLKFEDEGFYDYESAFFFAKDESEPVAKDETELLSRSLEAEAETAKIPDTQTATAAMVKNNNVQPTTTQEKPKPNKTLLYGGLGTLAALWYFSRD